MNPRTIPLETLANDISYSNKFLKLTKDNTKLVRDTIMLHNYSMARKANKSRKDYTPKAGDRDLLKTKNLSLKDGTAHVN